MIKGDKDLSRFLTPHQEYFSKQGGNSMRGKKILLVMGSPRKEGNSATLKIGDVVTYIAKGKWSSLFLN